MNIVSLNNEQLKKVQEIELEVLLELDRICRKHDIKYTLAYGTLIGAVRHKGFIPWDDDVDVCMLRKDLIKFRELCKSELSEKYFYQTHDTDKEYYHLFDKIRVNETVFKESFLAEYNIHHGIYIDIFPMDYIPQSFVKKKLQYYQFHFYRSGLMAKYLNINARNGIKKIAAKILRGFYFCFPLEKLYSGAVRVAMKYDEASQINEVQSFCSPYRTRDIFPKEIFEELVEMEFEEYKMSAIAQYDAVLHKLYADYMELPPIEKRIAKHDLIMLDI